MPETFKRIYQGQLSTPATPVYTVPAGTQTVVKHMRIVNLDTVPRWVKMWQGGTSDANIILPQVSIPAGGWMEFDGVLTMNSADTLAAQVEVIGEITLTVEGVEVT